MTCPGCHRDNDPRRRYCGKCGFNFEPVCRRCSFANDHDDRFCGGCGSVLIAAEGCHVKAGTARGKPTPAAPIAHAPPAGELSDLFAAPSTQAAPLELPEVGVGQDDLDRLFGVAL